MLKIQIHNNVSLLLYSMMFDNVNKNEIKVLL